MNQLALRLEQFADRLAITRGGRELLGYRFGDDLFYPYFYPVCAPSGVELTTASSEPYPHHHSLWLGHGNVGGDDFWQCDILPAGRKSGRIVARRVETTVAGPEPVVFEHESEWIRPDGRIAMCDRRRVRISLAGGGGWIMDLAVALRADSPVALGRTNHALFAARVPPNRAVTAGGRLLNSVGGRDEAGTFGQRAAWCDYAGTDGHGLAIFDHPANPWYRSLWFTRDYGFFSPSPFHWLDEPVTIGPAPLTLRYRVWAHGPVEPPALEAMAAALSAENEP